VDSEQPATTPPPTPPPAEAEPETLGERLRGARLGQDLTVEQLSTELRIEAKHLHALEENRFEEIGVPVFVKGYLKQYGQRLGLDLSDLLALYYKQTTLPDVEIQPSRTIKLRDERQITSWILAGVVLLAVVGLAVWWWNGGSFDAIPSFGGTGAAASDEAAPAASSAPDEPTPVRTSAPDAATPAEFAAPPAQAAPSASDAAADAAPPAAAPALADAEPADDEPRAAAPATIPLTFSFAAESWAEVTDARGERLLFGLNAAGRNVTVRGEPPFAIVLGNANGVQLTVAGEQFDIPQAGRQGDLARFAVDIAEE
jgi:cytoskeleton protein RodZ